MESLYSAITNAGNTDLDANTRRTSAVAAAALLIAHKAEGSSDTTLNHEIGQIGKFADQIQAALQVK